MKPRKHLCPHCGFRLDPDNPSEPVCPACGADPNDGSWLAQDLGLAAVLDDASAFAETFQSANYVFGPEVSSEPEVAYALDPELDSVIGDAESLKQTLMDGPIVVAGNGLIN